MCSQSDDPSGTTYAERAIPHRHDGSHELQQASDDAWTMPQVRAAIAPFSCFAQCPHCGAVDKVQLAPGWTKPGIAIPIIGCGNPWHYDPVSTDV